MIGLLMDTLPSSLINALKNNEIIPIVAAGVSMSIRDKHGERIFPSWEELLLIAAEKLELEKDDNNASLVKTFLKMKRFKDAAEHAYNGLKGSSWKKLIKEQFDPKLSDLDKNSAALPKAIWKLNDQIITLNYDRILQWSHSVPAQVSSLTNKAIANLPDILDSSDDPIVWHLHGNVDNTAELVLTPDSYANFYGEGKEVQTDYKGALEALKIVITTRSLLFIGCSLDDADLLLKIHQQQEMFTGNIKPHYALVKTDEKNAIEKKLEGTQIKLISFEDFGQPLLDKLSEMHQHISTEKEAKAVPNIVNVPFTNEDIPIKVAYLSANPLGFDYDYQPLSTILKKLPFEIDTFSLTEDKLNNLDGYDYIFIASKVVKNKLVIEDNFHCFDKNTLSELEENLGLEKRKGIFIFVDKLPSDDQLVDLKLPTLILPALDFDKHKKSLQKFHFQVFKNKNIAFYKDIGISYNEAGFDFNYTPLKNSKYILHKNTSNLPKAIDRCSMNKFVGRKDDLERLSQKIYGLEDDNGFLTIKGTGGLGKTTLIKKLTIAFADRGKYEDGIEFIDCEPITDFQQFRHRIASVFNLEQAQNLEEHLSKSFNNASYLIILDNFETLLYTLEKDKILQLLSFICDFATVIITSREFLKLDGEIEYTLRQMTLDEAFFLFSLRMENRDFSTKETKLIRDEIIDKLLDRNPLAITILAGCIMPNKNINALIDELKNDLFNKISEEDLEIFDNATDVHIDRKKSIYGSILYSYRMLNDVEKETFEKLSLFPDGIDFENFKRLSSRKNDKAIINERVINTLQNKSLIESNSTQIKLQSIVARFAEEMLKQREDKSSYYEAVFKYNYRLVDILGDLTIEMNPDKQRLALSLFDRQQNNVLKAISYLDLLKVTDEQICKFVDYSANLFLDICSHESFIHAISVKRQAFTGKVLQAFESILLSSRYFNGDFDQVYKELEKFMPLNSLENLNYHCPIEKISMVNLYGIYDMEGHEIISANFDKEYDRNFYSYGRALFSIGELDYNLATNCLISQTSLQVLYSLNKLNKNHIDKYIDKLHEKAHLELVTAYYIRSKFEPYERKKLESLVVVNPYTQGLIYLMYAFSEDDIESAKVFYQKALPCLQHIKYYFVEATYYYAKFLKENELDDFQAVFDEGYSMSKQHYYRFLQHCFEEVESPTGLVYDSNNYPLPDGVDFTDYIPKLTKRCIRKNQL